MAPNEGDLEVRCSQELMGELHWCCFIEIFKCVNKYWILCSVLCEFSCGKGVERWSHAWMMRTETGQQTSLLTGAVEVDTTRCQTKWHCYNPQMNTVGIVCM